MTTAMSMERAAAWWADRSRTPRPHRQTLIRWATRGVRGTRLQAERRGGRWFVTEEALVEFHRVINLVDVGQSRPAGVTRAAEIEANLAKLERKLARLAAWQSFPRSVRAGYPREARRLARRAAVALVELLEVAGRRAVHD